MLPLWSLLRQGTQTTGWAGHQTPPGGQKPAFSSNHSVDINIRSRGWGQGQKAKGLPEPDDGFGEEIKTHRAGRGVRLLSHKTQ